MHELEKQEYQQEQKLLSNETDGDAPASSSTSSRASLLTNKKVVLKVSLQGNGYFQTTAVASAGTNASGNGIFEYDVPTGYTALSTKGLNL